MEPKSTHYLTDYTKKLLREAGMFGCCLSTILLPEETILLSDMSSPEVDATYYSRIVGKLIYLTNTQLEISYSVGIVSHYMVTP